jgi:hypothetical protein
MTAAKPTIHAGTDMIGRHAELRTYVDPERRALVLGIDPPGLVLVKEGMTPLECARKFRDELGFHIAHLELLDRNRERPQDRPVE